MKSCERWLNPIAMTVINSWQDIAPSLRMYIFSFFTLYRLLTVLKKTSFENIVGKGENAGNLFPQCFPPFRKSISIFQLNLFCHLLMLEVWTSLKTCLLLISIAWCLTLLSTVFQSYHRDCHLLKSKVQHATDCFSCESSQWLGKGVVHHACYMLIKLTNLLFRLV